MSTRDPWVFSDSDLAKLCCVLIFDCVIASGLVRVYDFGALRVLAFGILVTQPVIAFNWGLLVALRRAQSMFTAEWPWLGATAVVATAFAIFWPPVMWLLIDRPGSAAAADWLTSPSPWASVQLSATALFWILAWKIPEPITEDLRSTQHPANSQERESLR